MGLETNKVKYKSDWPLVRLKEVCNRISDGTHFTPEYKSKGIPFISVKDIFDGEVHFEKCKYIDSKTHQELIKRCNPEKDDLLITKSGSIGRMALVPESPHFSLFVSVALIKNKKEIISSKFLKYCIENFINSIDISQDIKGGLLKNFHLEDIRETIVPIVSLFEQKKIVSKIEELVSELDKGVENLRLAQQMLITYRQAVFKWASEGKFTNRKIKDGEFPSGWKWVKLEEVAKKKSVKASPLDYPNAKFIGMDCIEPHTLKPSFLYDFKEFKSSGNYFKKNQVLYGRMRPYLNKVYMAEFDGVCSGEFIVLDCMGDLRPNLLKYILHSEEFVRFANSFTIGDRPRISYEEISGYKISIPAVEEQDKIVQFIDERLSVTDNLE
ncbi:MAG: restriction endonuclease subunit S, partial [Bacteroidota bacterium]|nr:restriction endonuclease subunit S [Bacteroidota bacterium]